MTDKLHDIALVSCVKSKKDTPSPARCLYTSSLFQKMSRYAERHARHWYILSAKYGLLHPNQIVEPYEQTLNSCKSADRQAWAERVHRQLADQGLLEDLPSILWLAGRNYSGDLRPKLTGCAHTDPMQGMPIGRRLQWLTAELTN